MKNKRRIRSYETKKRYVGFLFILPWMIGLLCFFIRPLVESILYSIGNLNMSDGFSLKIVGFEHYMRAFTQDSRFLPMLAESIPDALYQVPIIVIFSLFLAILINQEFHGRTLVRAIFFLPIIISSGSVLSIINGDVYNQMISSDTSASQLFSSDMLRILLKEMEIDESIVRFISNMVDSLLNLLWSAGMQTLLFLAALQAIPPSVYEAATIEGGSAWENFWKITFPMVSPTILINAIYSIIDRFNSYDNAVLRYINSFAIAGDFEFGAALSWVYTIVVLLFVGLFYFVINRYVYYEV